MPAAIPILIDGQWRSAAEAAAVIDPYRRDVVARMPLSTAADLDAPLQAAVAAKPVMAAVPGYERAALLRRASALLRERAGAIAKVMTRETGKAIKDARGRLSGPRTRSICRPRKRSRSRVSTCRSTGLCCMDRRRSGLSRMMRGVSPSNFGVGPCRSKPTPIGAITSRSSVIGLRTRRPTTRPCGSAAA